MENKDKNNTILPNNSKAWYQMLQQSSHLLPAIDKKDIEEAVDLLVGIGLTQIYDIFKENTDEGKLRHIFMDLKIKAFNSLLKTKKVLLEAQKYSDSLKSKEIHIPEEFKLGLNNSNKNEQPEG